MTTRIPAVNCLVCGCEICAATGLNPDIKPKPGSLSVCVDCGAVSAFADDLSLRPLTDSEAAQIEASPSTMEFLRKAVRVLNFVKAAKN